MKLYWFQSYDDVELRVCENQEQAELLFKKVMGYKVDNAFNHVSEVDEVDGYKINLEKNS